MVRDAAGHVIVTGTSGPDMLTLKYSGANGSVLWQRRYDGTANGDDWTIAKAVAVGSSGDVVVTGSPQNARGTDYYTAKYAAVDGTVLWEKRYNGPANGHDIASALAVDGGNVVVTGQSQNESGFDYYTAKYAARPSFIGSSADGLHHNNSRWHPPPLYRYPWPQLHHRARSYRYRSVEPRGHTDRALHDVIEHLDTAPASNAAFYRIREP
jgi:hypothetical protein